MTTERNIPVLYLVIPCYNEEAVLPETTKRLTEKMHTMIRAEQVDPESRILYVDDGSKDKTWAIISEYAEAIPYVDGVKLAHNRGHQNALLAGLMTAMPLCDCAISMDADLQDDINVIDRFVEKYMEGCDVVYGVRNKRETDTFFKRTTAEGFYKFMKILGVDVVFNHADYRLMSRRALEGLSDLMVTLRAVKKRLNPSISIFGVLLTMYDGRTNFSAQVAEEVRRHFPGKVFAAAIPRNVRLSEAPSHGMPVCAYDKFSRGAAAYDAVAQEILAKEQ